VEKGQRHAHWFKGHKGVARFRLDLEHVLVELAQFANILRDEAGASELSFHH
jgi:hypothetical protein